MKKSFVLYHDLCAVFKELDDDQSGQLIKSIVEYSESITEQKPIKPNALSGLMKAVFTPFKSHLDRDLQKYLNKVESCKNNGKKGGRPKQKNPTKAKKGVSVSVNVNDSVNEVIDYLNKKTGKKFKSTTKKYREHINARFNEKYTIDDFKKVIDIKVANWTGTEFEQYLQPVTLFGNKFDQYLNQPMVEPKPQQEEFLDLCRS